MKRTGFYAKKQLAFVNTLKENIQMMKFMFFLAELTNEDHLHKHMMDVEVYHDGLLLRGLIQNYAKEK